MDTLTHAVIGVLTARSCTRHKITRPYILIAAVSAAFPDLDYLLFWLDPYQFITVWHRSHTHSVLLLPVWAACISLIFYLAVHKRVPYGSLFSFSCLGLISHILMDLMTHYGVQLFAPANDHRYAGFILFDLDIWAALLAFCGLLPGLIKRKYAVLTLLLILTYLLLCFFSRQTAVNILESHIAKQTKQSLKSYVIPQAFLPFHWNLVIDHGRYYETAYFSMLPRISRFIDQQFQSRLPVQQPALQHGLIHGFTDYQSAESLHWQSTPKFSSANKTDHPVALEVWQNDKFSKFRRFALLPVLYRIDDDADSQCVWFTDLRYVLPYMTPPFRFGLCRSNNTAAWKLFRLRRYTDNSRQLIPS